MGHIAVNCPDMDLETPGLVVVFNAEIKPEDKQLGQVFGSNVQPKPKWCHVINEKNRRQKFRMIDPSLMKWEDW
jgi:hypothetical protein